MNEVTLCTIEFLDMYFNVICELIYSGCVYACYFVIFPFGFFMREFLET